MTGSLSLVGHSADVAAVMLALLEIPTIGRRLARLLGTSSLTGQERNRLAAVSAAHDIGKISQGFQHAPFDGQPNGAGHIQPFLSLLNDARRSVAKSHRRRLFAEGGLDRIAGLLGRDIAWEPLQAALAHHGGLPECGVANTALWQATAKHDPIAAAHRLTEAIQCWFPEAAGNQPIAWNAPFGHAFAGLLMLADWLGSDETVFKMAGEDGAPDGADRLAWSRPLARAMLARRLLAPDAARAACGVLDWTIPTLTGFPVASPAQAAMLSQRPPPETGRTTVIEDETGSGKTEAALIHFLRLFDRHAVDGMYFALPTRAAAVQIHRRMRERLQALLGDAAPPVILAVPGYLGAAEDGISALPNEQTLWPDGADDAMWAAARPKRYLAACIAVGTIDQALMGALQIRHAQLRSSALLRNLLVVDEIHATDVYMTTILRNLLAQHRRAGGHALLMSATLGAEARQALLTPLGTPPAVSAARAVATPYPAIWADDAGLLPSGATAILEPKAVHVDVEPDWRDAAQIAAKAVDAASRGARVLVIRNTVSAVVETQTALEAAGAAFSLSVPTPDGRVPAPHHARFAPEDRRRLDAALEAVLGANVARSGGSVTVASQTAEQSLDIDADLLITDLCPADVLLQRLGRLHRKRKTARVPAPGFETARAIVLAPTEAELAAALQENGTVRNPPLALGLVYPDLLGIVATRRALDGAVIRIPTDNRRLVEAAAHSASLKVLAEDLGGRWLKTWGQRRGALGAQEQAARRSCLDWDKAIAPLPDLERGIKTRLGLDDRLVELPSGTIGPFGTPISRLTVPGYWVAGEKPEACVRIEPAGAGTLNIRIGDRSFVYDRMGLRRTGVS